MNTSVNNPVADAICIGRLTAIAKTSHDPDTQTACLIRAANGDIIEAANCLPPGVEITPERVTRPLKYSFIVHAEKGAICKAACQGTALDGATLFLNWFPCEGCAYAMVSAGIARLVANRPAYEARKDDPRYGFGRSMEALLDAGVQIDWWGE